MMLSIPLSISPRGRRVRLISILFLILLPTLARSQPAVVQVDDRFDTELRGWTAFFADYHAEGSDYELTSGLRPLPPETGRTGSAFMLSGHNRSDDLMMGMTKRIGAPEGVIPGQSYWVDATIEFATKERKDAVGVGGSPSQSVIVCVGATPVAPTPVLVPEGNSQMWRLNVHYEMNGGIDGTPIGNVSNDLLEYRYVVVSRTGRHRFPVTAAANGDLWLTLLTDSGFEGLSTFYYTRVRYTLTPVDTSAGVLANVSTRATVAPGEGALIAGFVVDGAGDKLLLTRGAGPALAEYDVKNPLADPSIEVFRTGSISLVQNDNWGDAENAAEISALAAKVGAFPFAPASRDAAIAHRFGAGVYSTVVRGAAEATGEALAEVYDGALDDARCRLINLSSRASISDAAPAFGGVVVGGTRPACVLIRVLGPALGDLGVGNPALQPRLEIHGDQLRLTPRLVHLSGRRELAAVAGASVSAYPIPPGSNDLATAMNLPPGNYSFVFASDTPGVALLEVYLLNGSGT